MKPENKKTKTENLIEQFRTSKLCSDCRRRTIKGVKKIGDFSRPRQFCYSKQVYLETVNPIICNGFKKIFSESNQIQLNSIQLSNI